MMIPFENSRQIPHPSMRYMYVNIRFNTNTNQAYIYNPPLLNQ